MKFDNIEAAARSLRARLEQSSGLREQLGDIPAQFMAKYLEWCLKECGEESSRDFGLLRKVRSADAFTFLGYVELNPLVDGASLLRALCKKLHAPETITDQESTVCQDYLAFFQGSLRGGTETSISRLQLEIQNAFFEKKESSGPVRRLLAEELKRVVGPEVGALMINRPAALWYERPVGSWYVITVFQFGGWDQFKYLHRVYGSPQGRRGTELSGGISILSWLGLNPVSSWSWIKREDVTSVAQDVAELCRHFLSSVESLVSNLRSPFT